MYCNCTIFGRIALALVLLSKSLYCQGLVCTRVHARIKRVLWYVWNLFGGLVSDSDVSVLLYVICYWHLTFWSLWLRIAIFSTTCPWPHVCKFDVECIRVIGLRIATYQDTFTDNSNTCQQLNTFSFPGNTILSLPIFLV